MLHSVAYAGAPAMAARGDIPAACDVILPRREHAEVDEELAERVWRDVMAGEAGSLDGLRDHVVSWVRLIRADEPQAVEQEVNNQLRLP